jgi:hypothetical protein
VGRRGLLGPALASLALLIAGCGGGDGPTLTFDGTDEEQIAATAAKQDDGGERSAEP